MISVVAALAFYAALYALIRARGWAPVLVAFFLLFGFITRVVSIAYIDLAGPLYSQQLGTYVGGTAAATPMFVVAVGIVLLMLWLLIDPRWFAAHAAPLPTLATRVTDKLLFPVMALFVAALYIDMFQRGVIPLLVGMERFDYTRLYAGPFHVFLFDTLFMVAFFTGYGFVRPRFEGRALDLRYLGILIAFYAYFLLTGHRVSAFFTMTTWFLIPVAAAVMMARVGALPPAPDSVRQRRLMLGLKAFTPLLATGLAVTIAFSLYNSLVNVRGYEDPAEAFVQRSLVQPTELWWTTWDASCSSCDASDSLAWQLMFDEPLDATRNTGIQFLMVKALGYDRSSELLDLGEQFAGGYPEVLYELLGPILVVPAMLVFATLTVALMRLIMLAVATGRVLTMVFAVYVYYGFSLLYIGGMLNFALAWTFWVKLGALAAFWLIEGPWFRRFLPGAVRVAAA